MPHQGESRVTFHLSTQAAETEPIGKGGGAHDANGAHRAGGGHNAGGVQRARAPRAEPPRAGESTFATHDERPANFDTGAQRKVLTQAPNVGLERPFALTRRTMPSPSTRNPPSRTKSPAMRFNTSGTCHCNRNPPFVARVSRNSKYWQRFAVVNGRLE